MMVRGKTRRRRLVELRGGAAELAVETRRWRGLRREERTVEVERWRMLGIC